MAVPTKTAMAKRRRESSSASAPSKKEEEEEEEEETTKSTRRNHYTRPGVVAAARLVSLHPLSDSVVSWDAALSRYDDMILAKGGSRLVDLNARLEDLPLARRRFRDATTSRGGAIVPDDDDDDDDDAVLTKEQLLDVVVEWKFLKGKPRNALRPLLRSNTDTSVKSSSRRAFDAVDGIPTTMENLDARRAREVANAVNRMCEIRGVGPATASAVLCLYRPDIFAFMDDEVIECLYNGKRGYTLKIYMEVNDRCMEIASRLNEASGKREAKVGGGDSEGSSPFSSSGGGGGWTPCKVGKALWSVATMSANGDGRGLSAIFDDCDETTKLEGGYGTNRKNDGTRKSTKRSKTN